MMKSSFDKSNMDNYVENILAENLTVKRKLESKCQALLIINQKMSECIAERDQYKILSEQLQRKLSSLKKMPIKPNCFADYQDEFHLSNQDPKEVNRNLAFEVESLRQKLRDALGDIKALRTKLNQQKYPPDNTIAASQKMDKEEELVMQLEAMNKIKNQLEMDLQAVLDEKEELVTERDAYKCKIHRLNHEFNMLLKGDNRNVIDIDSLIMENRFLQEHLEQVQEELKLANQTIIRHKGMLEKRNLNKSGKIGLENIAESLLSQKQVQDLLQINSAEQVSSSPGTVTNLRSICMGLLENLNDTTLALVHQKKANRILATRIYELEQKIENMQGAGVLTFPSKILLNGYIGADVDKDTQDESTAAPAAKTTGSDDSAESSDSSEKKELIPSGINQGNETALVND